jgi:regulator of RNase E activity RraB
VATDLDQQLVLSASLVNQRVEMGDRAELSRSVDHMAFFKSRSKAEEAARDLQAAGFKIDGVKRRFLRVAVEFSRTDAVDHATASAFTREVVTVINKHDGDYDGWGSFLCE